MNEIIFNALMKYFNTLQYTGYINYEEVNKILYLIGIQEMTQTDFNGDLTEEDYRIINGAINCLFGSSCLIPYPSCKCN